MLKKLLGLVISVLLLSACTSTTTTTTNSENSETPMAASTLSPTAAAANYNVELGMGYLQQGDMQRAKRKLLLALSQAPDWAPAQEAMGYFLLSTGETKRAEHYYLQAVKINPAAGATQNNYGVYLCRMGRYREADQHYMLAVQDPNYINTAEAYENAGLCAMQARDNTKAQGYFQKAIQQDPKRATSFLELAQLTYQQNNYKLAQQYFNNYAQLAANNMGSDGLGLGIRLAHKLNNPAIAQQYTLQLQNRYPNSMEYKQLRAATPDRMPVV